MDEHTTESAPFEAVANESALREAFKDYLRKEQIHEGTIPQYVSALNAAVSNAAKQKGLLSSGESLLSVNDPYQINQIWGWWENTILQRNMQNSEVRRLANPVYKTAMRRWYEYKCATIDGLKALSADSGSKTTVMITPSRSLDEDTPSEKDWTAMRVPSHGVRLKTVLGGFLRYYKKKRSQNIEQIFLRNLINDKYLVVQEGDLEEGTQGFFNLRTKLLTNLESISNIDPFLQSFDSVQTYALSMVNYIMGKKGVAILADLSKKAFHIRTVYSGISVRSLNLRVKTVVRARLFPLFKQYFSIAIQTI